jgi:hypothetical protein
MLPTRRPDLLVLLALAACADPTVATSRLAQSADDYVDRCRDANVPIPPDWPFDPWVYQGDMDPGLMFNSTFGVNLVHTYQDPSVPGICVTLARRSSPGSESTHLDVICQSATTGKACFWEADLPSSDGPVAVVALGNGDTLAQNCTNCHRGDNAFIIHPDTLLDFRPHSDSPVWYQPISRQASWQNPPAFENRNTSMCSTCHSVANVTLDATRYCAAVMGRAAELTMPHRNDPVGWLNPGGMFAANAQHIRAACEGDEPPRCGDEDINRNGIGDLCERCGFADADSDGSLDGCDTCPGLHDPDQRDADGDGIGDPCDICPAHHNPQQSKDGDRDGDGTLDGCDDCPRQPSHPMEGRPADQRECEPGAGQVGDGWCTADCADPGRPPKGEDNCPAAYNYSQSDIDGDGRGDLCDDDIDGDGRKNPDDRCPTVAEKLEIDRDGDGVSRGCDCDDADAGRRWVGDCLVDERTLARLEAAASLLDAWGYPPFWDGAWQDLVGCSELGCLGPVLGEEIDRIIGVLGSTLDLPRLTDVIFDEGVKESGLSWDDLASWIEGQLLWSTLDERRR